MGIEENKKFRKSEKEELSDSPTNLKEFVTEIKKKFGLRYDL